MDVEDGWVTGAAIDTLLALRGLKEGDELMFTNDRWHLHQGLKEEDIVTVKDPAPRRSAWWGEPPGRPLLCIARNSVCGSIGVTRENVKGWRLPRGGR